jgi:hypothetical protein
MIFGQPQFALSAIYLTDTVVAPWASMAQFKAYRASAALADARKVGDKYAKFRSWAIEGMAH